MVFYPFKSCHEHMFDNANIEKKMFLEDSLFDSFTDLPSKRRLAVEEWVVNSVKVKMIRKLDVLVDTAGKINSRKLFLVPLFTIDQLCNRVDGVAPELRTLFYKELSGVVLEAKRLFLNQ